MTHESDHPLSALTALTALPALLRAARHEADLSQRELADRAGVSKGVIANAEAGRTGLSLVALLRLLAAAGCRLVALGPSGEPLARRPYEEARDRGYRAWPAHLDVRPVRNDGDWWFGYARPGTVPLPPYTADGRSRRDVRRRRLAREAGNTPEEPSMGGEDDPDG